MKKKKEVRLYDLSAKIYSNLVVFPGNPDSSSEEVSSLNKGQFFNLSHLHLGSHISTHIDFPAYKIKNHKTSSNYPINYLIDLGIIDVPSSEKNHKGICIQITD